MYPCSSTTLERPLLLEQMTVRYQVMKRKWQQLLPGSVRLRLNGTDGKTQHTFGHVTMKSVPGYQTFSLLCFFPLCFLAELVAAVRFFEQRQEAEQKQQQHQSEEVRERVSFLELQAQVK